MSVSEKEIKEKEEQYKESLEKRITALISNQTKLIGVIQEEANRLGISGEIPNIAITFNNKLIELAKEFSKSKISMYVIANDTFDIIIPSYIGEAIIKDLNRLIGSATNIFAEYEEEYGLRKDTILKRISGIFSKKSIRSAFYSEDEYEDLKMCIDSYKEINSNMDKYELRDNIVDALYKSMKEDRYIEEKQDELARLMEREIEPSMRCLGLEDLIPVLQERIGLRSNEAMNNDSRIVAHENREKVKNEESR